MGSRLIKPSQYAKECGISRQAVYAKIKKGTLKAKKINGHIFIEIDNSIDLSSNKKDENQEFNQDLIKAKDETIQILKETIDDLKATNNLIIGTLKSEVDLLKSAFNEMQILYRNQIKQLQNSETLELEPKKKEPELIESSNDFIEIKELAKSLNLSKKECKKFIKKAKKLQKNGDFRFILVDDDIYATKNANYNDILTF